MVAATNGNGAEPTRETWRDWLPEGAPDSEDLITRDELLTELHRAGVAASVEDLRNWQRAGAIPYGIRRWHEGATRVLYPPWMGQVVRWLRRLQDEGGELSAIGPRLLGIVRGELPPPGSATVDAPAATATATGNPAGISVADVLPGRLVLTGHDATGELTAEAKPITVPQRHPVAASARAEAHGSAPPLAVALPEHLRPALAAWAHDYERRVGLKVARVDVSLVDERGRPLRFTFAIEPNEYSNNSLGMLKSGRSRRPTRRTPTKGAPR